MDKIEKICISLLMVAIILLIYVVCVVLNIRISALETDDIVEVHRFGSKPSPIVTLIGSVHGNERAGTLALEQLIMEQSNKLNEFPGTLIIIPRPNPTGILNDVRHAIDPVHGVIDINRTYKCEEPNCPQITGLIKNLVENSDLVVEFHEAYDFHQINKSSLGSCIIPTHHNITFKTSDIIVKNLNANITDPLKKFITLDRNSCEIPTSLSCYCETNNIPYILVEITGQLNKQPIDKRIQQVRTITDTIIGKN
jgi:predicted deacylase